MSTATIENRRASEDLVLPAATLAAFAARVLHALGVSEPDAEAASQLLVEADLTGADAHGIFRLPQYATMIRQGAINPTPSITVHRSAAATAIVDGGDGLGHLVMKKAAETAVELAREAGIGWVGARNSNHAGSASIWAALPVEHGMIGLYSAVASANHMAIWGGTEPALGTNPLAIGLPAGDGNLLMLDMATTVVSYGTIKKYALHGKPLPEGWMIDRRSGGPLTDPGQSAEGLLLPIGGYKGSGLALMLGFLAGTLNGAAMGLDVVDFNAVSNQPTNTGQFVVALDVNRFRPLAEFESEVRRHAEALKAGARLPGVDAIRLPGENRSARRTERLRQGVPLPAPLLQRLNDLARELGTAPLA
ncbi:Ldh family oxidoreductase [Ancylobacter sonchi]|uniref:Ldh family oxidoreductase n=1 Tax=Ancylobacter sonchi TaxID=1937790 RepID=UPI001BD4091F|nr:Ldh family oxidoreductase [Ancylobacter sonchi]MBS7532470.1 Ldh family oxidoreductase [Ancylobacter sonchi]